MVTSIDFKYEQFFFCTQLNGFKYCYLTLIILFNIDDNPKKNKTNEFNINHLFAHS